MLKLSCDHYFHAGAMHTINGKPCQDYAISGSFEDIVFGIVSDGCSSGGNTDVGSRLLSLSTLSVMKELNVLSETAAQEIDFRRKVMVFGIKQILGLKTEDLLATCLYVYLTPNGGFVNIAGDGAIAFLNTNGDISMSSFEWDKNMPFYPAYAENNFKSFIDAHSGDPTAQVLTREDWKFSQSKSEYVSNGSIFYSINDCIRGISFPISAEAMNGLSYVAVFTDGVKQVDGIDWKVTISELLSFKSLAGEFAKRRMIRFIQNSRASGRGPIDDIAYSVVRIASVGDGQ